MITRTYWQYRCCRCLALIRRTPRVVNRHNGTVFCQRCRVLRGERDGVSFPIPYIETVAEDIRYAQEE